MGNMLPGIEWGDYVDTNEGKKDYFTEGVDKRFFDAGELDGTPAYQENAVGAATYILHLIFPTREHLLRAIKAFTLGERKGLLPNARLASINGVAMSDSGYQWLRVWESKMLNIHIGEPDAPSSEELSDDEAQQAPL